MIHPHKKRCFLTEHHKAPVSAIGIKKLLDAGKLAPMSIVYYLIDGEQEAYTAFAVGNFLAPRRMMTAKTDPHVPDDIGDIDETHLASFEEDFFE